MNINYTIQVLVAKHCFKVQLEFMAISSQHELSLPTWIPGSYMLREFSRNLYNLSAKQAGLTIECQQISKNQWQLAKLVPHEIIQISYEVYAYELGIRSAYIDFKRAYFNPTSVCLAVTGQVELIHTIRFLDLATNWRVTSALLKSAENYFIADNYNQLIDTPFELGEFKQLEFKLANLEHSIVLSGSILPFDEQRFIADITKICAYQIKLFNEHVPYPKYVFILNLAGEVYTGLEHANSTLLMAPSYSLPNLAKTNDEEYFKLLALISHEFFHTWNVKAIKPQAFIPYDLTHENYTKLLWWFEGVTSYYDDLVLYRTGIIDQAKYLQIVLENVNNVYKFAGVNVQTVANSSLTCWIKYYRQDENSPNIIVSYYVKGALIALCLDLIIRSQSNFSLDDVLRYLSQHYVNGGAGIAEDELASVIKLAVNVELGDFLKLATESTAMLPLNDLLQLFGLALSAGADGNHQNNGKYISGVGENLAPAASIEIGAKLLAQPLGYLVKNVYANTAAQSAGLAAGDLLIALNQVQLVNFAKQIAFYTLGDDITLSLLRHGRLLDLNLTLSRSPCKIFNLQLVASDKLKHWL